MSIMMYDESEMEDLCVEAERQGYENGFDEGYEKASAEAGAEEREKGYKEGKEEGYEKALKEAVDVGQVAKALDDAGYGFLAKELREWSILSSHVRSFTPPSFLRK
jgi:flagellar biosynthesis/type III secretory pathway protein FliH